MNGRDRGLIPPQLFVATLASCIAVFATSYCNNTGINAAGLSVSLPFDKLTKPTGLGSLKAVISRPQSDAGDKATAVVRAAQHCPIHETIRVSPDGDIAPEQHLCADTIMR